MDVLVRAVYRAGKIELEGRRGHYEDSAPDVFFLREADASKLPRSWAKLISPPDRGHVRVRWPEQPSGSRAARLAAFFPTFDELGVEPLEADVDPVRRWVLDHPRAQFPEPGDWRLFFYDLETERVADWSKPWRSRILSFSWSSSTGRRGHVRARALTDAAEQELLREWVRLAGEHDVALAWNGDDFDHRVVSGRAEIHALDLPEIHFLDHLRVFKRNFLRTEDGAIKQSFKLEAIAAALLGEERKVPLEERARALGWSGTGDLFAWSWEHAPDLFREYNDQDVRLMELLEERTHFLALHFAVCRLCRVFPAANSVNPSVQIDGRMLTIGEERGFRFPTKRQREPGDVSGAVLGAFVPEAIVGLHRSVAVLDFARMYPSIIRAWNMSLETLVGEGAKAAAVVPETDERGERTGKVVARFDRSREGIVPAALRAVIEERAKWSKLKDAAVVGSKEWHDAGRLSTACKALANSFYGVLLDATSRFYRVEIGSSVTSIGRLLLSSTMAEVRRRGHPFIFGDTDSVAFVADDEQAVAVRDAVNEVVVPAIVDECGAARGELRITYEKRFREVLVTASKKYAGRFAVYDGKPVEGSKIDVRGLEIVRSDQCAAARAFQRRMVERLLDGVSSADAWAEVEEHREAVLGGKLAVEDLIFRKSISKLPSEYGTKPPQARVAERLGELGEEVVAGMKVAYAWDVGGRAVAERELEAGAGKIDLATYWNRYVYPPTMRCLRSAFPEGGWERLEAPANWRPDQLEFFRARAGGSQIDLRSAPAGEPAKPKTRKGRRPAPAARKSDLIFVLEEDADEDLITRLGDSMIAYRGDLRVDLEVRSERQRATVELACPQHVRDPDLDLAFASVLRKLGVAWRRPNMSSDGTTKTERAQHHERAVEGGEAGAGEAGGVEVGGGAGAGGGRVRRGRRRAAPAE